MLSAQLSNKESNVASRLRKGYAVHGGFKEGYLRGECERKPCTNGMWCLEKMEAANGALLLHLLIAKPCARRWACSRARGGPRCTAGGTAADAYARAVHQPWPAAARSAVCVVQEKGRDIFDLLRVCRRVGETV